MVEVINIFIKNSIIFEISKYLFIEDLLLLKSSCLILKYCDWHIIWIECLKRYPYRFYNITYLSDIPSNQIEIHAIHTARSLKTLLKAIQIDAQFQREQQLLLQSSQSLLTNNMTNNNGYNNNNNDNDNNNSINNYLHEVDLLWILARLNDNSLLRNSFGFIYNSLNWIQGFLTSLSNPRHGLFFIRGSNVAQNNQVQSYESYFSHSLHSICDLYFLIFDISQQYLKDDIHLINKCIVIMTEVLKYLKSRDAFGTPAFLVKSRNEAVIDGLMNILGYHDTKDITLFRSICDIFVILEKCSLYINACKAKMGVCNRLINQLHEFNGDAEQFRQLYLAADAVLHQHSFVATVKNQDANINWKYILNLNKLLITCSLDDKLFINDASRQLNWLKFMKAHMFQPQQLQFIDDLHRRISEINDLDSNGNDNSN